MNEPTRQNGRKLFRVLIPLAVAVLSGCASQPTAFSAFTPEDLNAKVRSGKLKQKVDNFHVIMDASGSMDSTYQGAGFPENTSASKFEVEKEFLHRMNLTIPHLKLNSGLRTFGYGSCLEGDSTALRVPQSPYSPSAFDSGLNAQECAGGGTPLAKALDSGAGDIQSAQGKTALIVVSDGKNPNGETADAAINLKKQFGDRLCIHTVWAGNPDDEPGRELLGLLAKLSECGTDSALGDVMSSAGAANFVTKVFLEAGGGDCSALDADGDGVNDCLDKCPNTPRGIKVDKSGCWVLSNVLFDTDKAVIKPVSYPELDQVVKTFKDNPGLRVEVDGHTDSQGSDEHNVDLSQRRAAAVAEYITHHGIAPERLTSKGFGESQPVADNNTVEGRALNRRVELKVIK